MKPLLTSPHCLATCPGPHITSSHSVEPTLPKSPPSQLMKRRLLRGWKPGAGGWAQLGTKQRHPSPFVCLCPGPLGSLLPSLTQPWVCSDSTLTAMEKIYIWNLPFNLHSDAGLLLLSCLDEEMEM